MRKKNRSKYFITGILCFSIVIYGFIKINIYKPELVRKKSVFTMDLTLKPLDVRIETDGYVFYLNNKVIDGVKEKCNDTYNDIFSK